MMAALTCDACGSTSLTMTDDGQFSVCDYCGTKHTIERVRAKVQEIKGVVEITKGEAEKERLIKNAETFLKLNDTPKAKEIYHCLVNDYPNDVKMWIGLARCYFSELPSMYEKEELLDPKSAYSSNVSSLIDIENKAILLDSNTKITFEKLWEEHAKKVEDYSGNLIKRYYNNEGFEDILTNLIDENHIPPKSHHRILSLLKSKAEQIECKLSSSNLLNRVKQLNIEYAKKSSDFLFSGRKNVCIPDYETIRHIEYLSSRDAIISCEYNAIKNRYYVLFKKSYTEQELVNSLLLPSETEQQCIDNVLTLKNYLNNIPCIEKWIATYGYSNHKDEVFHTRFSIYNVRIQNNTDVSNGAPSLAVIFDYTISQYCTITKRTKNNEIQNSKITIGCAKKDLEEMKAFCKNNNLCAHCGGKIKGIFSLTCSKCGTPKDY